jgi:hypothetical protein
MITLNLIGDGIFTLLAAFMLGNMLLPSAPCWNGDRPAAIGGIIALVTLLWMTIRVWALQAPALL